MDFLDLKDMILHPRWKESLLVGGVRGGAVAFRKRHREDAGFDYNRCVDMGKILVVGAGVRFGRFGILGDAHEAFFEEDTRLPGFLHLDERGVEYLR